MNTSNNYILLSETLIPETMAGEMLRHFTQPHTTDLFFPRKIYFDNHETILELSFFKDLGEIRYLINTEEKKFKDDAICENLSRNTIRKIFEIKSDGDVSGFTDQASRRMELILMEYDSNNSINEEAARKAKEQANYRLIDSHIICTPVIGNVREAMILSAFSCDVESYCASAANQPEGALSILQKGVKKFYDRVAMT